jgi:hypothetical protein
VAEPARTAADPLAIGRHRAAHSCKPLPLADAAARAHTRELIRETYGASGSASAAAPKPPSAPPPAKRVKKAGSAAIELMRLKQFSKQGRGEVRERADRWHLRIQIDLKAEGAWTEPATREADRKLEGTYWKKVRRSEAKTGVGASGG